MLEELMAKSQYSFLHAIKYVYILNDISNVTDIFLLYFKNG